MGSQSTWVEKSSRLKHSFPRDDELSAVARTPIALFNEVSHNGGVPDETFKLP